MLPLESPSNSPHIASPNSSGRFSHLFEEAFRGRSIFVTGHTGFKGSWLCLWLNRLGARITGYALAPPTNPNHFTIAGAEQYLERHYEADIRDESSLLDAMQDSQPDVVLHLAAQTVVRHGFQHPRDTFDVNVMGTVSVLECVRKLGKPCVVIVVSSDKCYENREQVWGYRECDPMGEHDPYGASKGAAELVVRAYRESYFQPDRLRTHGVKLASARAGNVIGGGDFTSDALLVDAMHALHARIPIRIRNPRALRPWQHVLQALSGYLTLSARMLQSDDPALCSGWNFGPRPGNELSVRDVVDLLIQEWGEGNWVDASDPNQPLESCILRLAIDKALWQLGWKPHWDILTSLQQTARWYRAYFAGSKSLTQFALDQIDAYEKSWNREPTDPIPACSLPVSVTPSVPALN
jgi:CDP-glucose 4,6-dehydratase